MKCKNKQTKQCVDELNEFKLEMRKYISTKCHCKFSSCTRKYRILLRYVLELCAFKLFRFFFVFSFSFILFNLFCVWNYSLRLNRLTANPTKWSNTLKQFAGNLPTNCLSVFDHFVKMALKGLTQGEFFWGFSDNIWQIAVIWIYFGILTWSIF